MILYSGPSKITREPIVAILTGYDRNSKNPKTGAMLQTWIIPQANPLLAESKRSVCGDCKLSPSNEGGCYVMPLSYKSVWNKWQRGGYPHASYPEVHEIVDGRMVRLGAWGDPAAVPVGIWKDMLREAQGWTGYTHQWRTARELQPYCMASVDNAMEARIAQSEGWRTFRIGKGDPHPGVEVRCPASKEADYLTTCAKCGICNGGAALPGTPNVMIAPHGPLRRG